METKRPKVLVIDDEPTHADTLAMVLNISGFEAIAAHSATHGVDLAMQTAFDYLVTDVVMNGMNGIDAAIAIHRLLPNCRILLISGNNDTSPLLDAAIAQGHAFDILAKPVHPTVLLSYLRAPAGTIPE
ncbi:response regulator [Telmatobacter sp. DSM 110680]|uniref:Response regulator n=1 Tax=Telmatobacter sp. DSM 110680 TaxID=3036704 RepID=A0AAU7DDM2_9BACT